MRPTLSIIIPVYKVELYLHECISSILNQAFTDFELILIDDGSPDNSGKICDEYALNDKRIIVIHQKNNGVSSARNEGLDRATGSYITFVDSDDTIEKDTYFYNMEILLKDKSIDVLEYPYQKVYNKKTELVTDPTKHIYGCVDIFLYWTLRSKKAPVLWNKIYKKNIFKNVRFPYGKVYEDFYALPEIAENTSHLYISNKGGYFYLIRNDSLSNGSDPFKREQSLKKQLDNYDAWLKVNDKIKHYNAYSKERILSYYRFSSAFICTAIDYPNINLSRYEKRVEKFNFNLLQILTSKLNNKEKFKLMLINIIGIKWLIVLYKYLKKRQHRIKPN
jgi:Glycosyltransferases involved in cell wall biogenesis